MESVPIRKGTTVPLTALQAGASRLSRLSALRLLEYGLAADGWVRVECPCAPVGELYRVGEALLADRSACEACRRDRLIEATDPQPLGLTYLEVGDEPLYDANASQQRVRSLNMHEEILPDQCDAMLPATCGEEDRQLAYAYHTWPIDARYHAVRDAARTLRHDLVSNVAAPLLRAFASLLGLEEGALLARTEGRCSDNTSMLRMLEYPLADHATSSAVWGVSEHTDFEIFSLLNQQSAGLQVQDPKGVWHQVGLTAETEAQSGRLPASVKQLAADMAAKPMAMPDLLCNGSWVILVGDMLERLSRGYWRASPHRVPPTMPTAPVPRRSVVFFVGFDEEEAVAAVPPQLARRSITGGYKLWDDACNERRAAVTGARPSLGANVPDDHRRPMTQREWTEWKESAARERLRQRAAAEEDVRTLHS